MKNKTFIEKHSYLLSHRCASSRVQILIYSFSSIAELVCAKGVCEGRCVCVFEEWETHHPFFIHQHRGLLQSVMG